ncbi:tRNA pseudouridine synthase A [Desulfamplus magnetovallimortis]|uniref:tRNA pseudouridine synthase A n=1 Tax=Desulfamplus magnetovallimortis TaxID=1246637 RepID=A0A1W1HAH8_9BACT|nr:hypothetical protein [Desulfamplus magnetovallimortis]SLM29405.1 tRNA pseudouridine synthase A [Desulfamplus magnetovallimortis]
MTTIVFIALAAFSSWLIAKSCDGFEDAADYLGRNMTEGTKGATINAVGSSMPELWVTFIYLFLFRDTTGFSGGIGTTAGSAVFNSMVIPSLVILAVLIKSSDTVIQVSKKVVLRDGLTLIFAELILIVTLGDTLYWYHGFMFMMIYVAYAIYIIIRHRINRNGNAQAHDETGEEENDEDDEEEFSGSKLKAFLTVNLTHAVLGNDEIKTSNATILLAVSTAYIATACWILVYACEHIGISLGIHGYFVAVILAAAASSVPDTILSIKDARKGNYDDAVSNALGSNIFDICFALGAPLFLYTVIFGPIVMPPEMINHIVELRILLLLLTIATFIAFLSFKKMTKGMAYLLLFMYSLFVLYVAGRAGEVGIANSVADMLHFIQGVIQ